MAPPPLSRIVSAPQLAPMHSPSSSSWLKVTVKPNTSLRGWSMRRKFACQVIKVLVSPSEIRRLTLVPLNPAFCTSTDSSKVTVTSTRSPPEGVGAVGRARGHAHIGDRRRRLDREHRGEDRRSADRARFCSDK